MFKFFREFRFNKQITIVLLALSLLGLCGAWLLLYSTPRGLGLNDDSIAYIAAARSLMAGDGFREAWLLSNKPMTHFPPGFPGILAFIGIVTGLDPLRGARAFNAIIFGLNVGLTGLLGWRMTGSRIASLVVATLTLTSSSLLYVHSRAMSEPLYIFLTLLSFLLLDLYLERSKTNTTHTWSLVVLGFVLGWAYLTRYAALSLFATMLVVMLIVYNNWRKRLKSVAILCLSTIPWIVTWSIRNRIVGGTYTNRHLGWHPITLDNWMLGVDTLAEFFVPINEWRRHLLRLPGIFEGILIALGLSLLIWILVKGLPRFFKPSRVQTFAPLTFTVALYIIGYLTLLTTTMTLFDPATKFQVRILSPIYISLLLLLTTIGSRLWQKKKMVWKSIVVLSALGLLAMFSYSQYVFVDYFRESGGTFAKEKWSELDALDAIQRLPENIIILTNEPGVVYLYTGRPSGVLPKDDAGIAGIKQPVLDGKVVIVLFRVNKVDEDTFRYYIKLGYGLYQIDFSNAWMFSAIPK